MVYFKENLVQVKLLEPEVDSAGSEYIQENLKSLKKYVMKLGIIDKAEDLLMDVYVSLKEAENDGNGYNMNYGGQNGNGQPISVEQFIYGRIKKYSLNDKYKTTRIDSCSTVMSGIKTTYINKLDNDGNYIQLKDKCGKPVFDTNGRPVYELEKTRKKVKTKVDCSVYAATFQEPDSDIEECSGFQFAYKNATEDNKNIDDVEEAVGISADIERCIDICSPRDLNILAVLKNIDEIVALINDDTVSVGAYSSVFIQIKELAKKHSDFYASFLNIMSFSSKNHSEFKRIIASY